ncbi:MAG: hypothetical protein O3B42_10340, partial [Actinomycetota bacterium]|nr:hypothetical protein [Actinomycetota bacterium]
FLEAVGATPPAPSGTDAMAELTKENEVVTPDSQDSTPDDPQAAPEQRDEQGDEDEDSHEEDDPATAPADDSAEGQTAEAIGGDDPPEVDGAPVEGDKTDHGGVRDLSTTITRTTQITVSSFDGNPGTANATYDRLVPIPPPPRPASLLPAAAAADVAGATAPDATVQQSLEAEQDVAGAGGHTMDSELSRPLRSRRAFRWPIVVVLLVLIAAVAAAAIWLPIATEAEALVVRQAYYDATSAVRNQLPDTQGALDAITRAGSTAEELSGSIPVIAQLDSLAADMERAAAEPLPSVLPLVPKGPIDALEPLQDQTAQLGADGTEVADRLGNAYIYRVEIPGLMDVGNLPTSASTETVNTISVTLATSLSNDAGAIAALPDDGAFEAVRSEAVETHTRYIQWQTEYLNALASENTSAALELVAELETLRTSLTGTNASALGVFRSEMDGLIVTYAVRLETHMGNISRV